jgi:hypothetical protein
MTRWESDWRVLNCFGRVANLLLGRRAEFIVAARNDLGPQLPRMSGNPLQGSVRGKWDFRFGVEREVPKIERRKRARVYRIVGPMVYYGLLRGLSLRSIGGRATL